MYPSCAQPHARVGFTLIEVLLVVVIISVLTSLVLPSVFGACRSASEATLRANLHELRSSIERFASDMGRYPWSLGELYARDTVPKGERTFWKGPYVSMGLHVALSGPATRERRWRYDWSTGDVHSTSTAIGLDGTPYSTW